MIRLSMIRLSIIFCSLLWLVGCGSSAPKPPALAANASPPSILFERESPELDEALDLTVPEIELPEVEEEEEAHLPMGEHAQLVFDGRIPCSSLVKYEPIELQFGCVYVLSREEMFLADKLKSTTLSKQLRAAELLWRNHSRRHAKDVLRFCDESNSVSPEFLKFKQECTEDCQPEQVLHELRAGDYLWGTWLATLRPDPTFVTVLIDGLEQKPNARNATILALGKTRDQRAQEALLNALRSKDDEEAGFAAAALADFGSDELEQKLLAALGRSRTWSRTWTCANICRTLEKIGTSRSLPHLEPIAASTEFTGAINLQRAAQRAIDSIQSRLP